MGGFDRGSSNLSFHARKNEKTLLPQAEKKTRSPDRESGGAREKVFSKMEAHKTSNLW